MLLITLYKVVINFKPVHGILNCDNSNESLLSSAFCDVDDAVLGESFF